MKRTTISYEFEDGEVYTLLDQGFSSGDLWKLQEIHGRLLCWLTEEKNGRVHGYDKEGNYIDEK